MKKIFLSFILLLFIIISYFPINNYNVVAKEQKSKIIYGDWVFERTTNCLVDENNIPFKKDYVKYEHDISGMCKRYTRDVVKRDMD